MNASPVSDGFNRTYIFLSNMGKQEHLLHKSSKNYDFSNPTYACGDPVLHRPNLTDAQALALKTCPKCFPDGRPAHLLGKGKVLKVESKGAGWL